MSLSPDNINNLIILLHQAVANDQVVNVSNIKADGSDVSLIPKPIGVSQNKTVYGFPIVSDNYQAYRLAMEMLGPEYSEYADRYMALYGGGLRAVRYSSNPTISIQPLTVSNGKEFFTAEELFSAAVFIPSYLAERWRKREDIERGYLLQEEAMLPLRYRFKDDRLNKQQIFEVNTELQDIVTKPEINLIQEARYARYLAEMKLRMKEMHKIKEILRPMYEDGRVTIIDRARGLMSVILTSDYVSVMKILPYNERYTFVPTQGTIRELEMIFERLDMWTLLRREWYHDEE
jgi:hypothetical protein